MGDRGFDTIGRKLHADVLFACKQFEGMRQSLVLLRSSSHVLMTVAGAKRGYMLCLDAQPINGRLWQSLSECYFRLSVS
jgi:hypothetical protein